MKLVTSSQMRELDRRAIAGGMPGSVLMENAGRAVAREALRLLSCVAAESVYVVCGTGNNGGDGFVAARHMALAGAGVTVGIAGAPEKIAGDAATNYQLVRAMGIETLSGDECVRALERCALAGRSGTSRGRVVVVDALLGTGAQGEPRGAVAEAIRAVAGGRFAVVSVDVPSGVDADTGQVAACAVRADVTVTFGYPKPGLLMYPGADYVGRLVVDPIGYDWTPIRDRNVEDLEWFDDVSARRAMPLRYADSHKGTFGHVLVIGGSASMSGAPSLAARGALRTGAGLVTVAVPQCIHTAVAARQAEAMCVPLPDEDGAVSVKAVAALESTMQRATAICVGPGLSRSDNATEVVRWLLKSAAVPVVADADALAAIAEDPDLVRMREAATILTPHPGECSKLLARPTDSIQFNRLAAVRDAVKQYRATVVLKGARTLISAPAVAGSIGRDPVPPRTAIVTAGNPGMATGGSGDVLTGVIGALAAQGLDAYTAAALGVYVHARAGDRAAQRLGVRGLIAGDIADEIASTLNELAAETRKEEPVLHETI